MGLGGEHEEQGQGGSKSQIGSPQLRHIDGVYHRLGAADQKGVEDVRADNGPTAIATSLSRTAGRVAASSGKLVPTETNVQSTKTSETPMARAIETLPSTVSTAPIKKPTMPITRNSKSRNGRLSWSASRSASAVASVDGQPCHAG